MPEKKKKSIDQATLEMLDKASEDSCSTVFDRAEQNMPCPIGAEGSCCKNCSMGPCRVSLAVGDEEDSATKSLRRGVCGATPETIAARNFARMVAAGSAAHGDHGRRVAELFKAVAHGKAPGYQIKDEQKLLQLALELGIQIGDRSNEDIAKDIADIAMAEFGKQDGEIAFVKRAPLKRQEVWQQNGVVPRGVDREVVERLVVPGRTAVVLYLCHPRYTARCQRGELLVESLRYARLVGHTGNNCLWIAVTRE